MDTTVADSLIGVVLDGRYEIRDRLARGGMATVYEAVDARLDRRVAVKVMHPALAGDPRFVARFHREAKTAAQLSSPCAVAVTDQGIDPGPAGDRVFLVMELVNGPTLRRRLTEHGALSPAEALDILESVLRALAAAHRAGMVHRDVKPENILLGYPAPGTAGPEARWQVKVADFGLARAIEASPLTAATGLLLGTVAYLAPELVVTGSGDARADVYAAGILAFEMLTGRPPHDADTPLAVAYRHVNADVPSPSLVRASVPPALDDLVLPATARDPRRRPADASVMLEMLLRARAAMRFATSPIPLGERHTDILVTQAPPGPAPPGPMTGPMPPGPAPAPAPPKRRGRRLFLWLLVLVVAAGLVGGVGWWLGAGRYVSVPQLVGLDRDAAERAVDGAHLQAALDPGVASESVAVGQVAEQAPSPGGRVPRGGLVHLRMSLGPERFTVPDLAGMSLDDARTALSVSKLDVGQVNQGFDDNIPAGKVESSDPQPGEKVKRGTAVSLLMSEGPAPVDVPDVTNQPADDAARTLQGLGLQVQRSKEHSTDVPSGNVISVNPTGTVSRGTTVTIAVSSGPQLVWLPDVKGVRMSEATAKLEALGFSVHKASLPGFDPPVLDQSPSGDQMVAAGTTVSLFGM